MSYNSEIKATENPDIDDFIKAATDNVPPSLRERPWACDDMNHGKSVLNNEEQLNCYMAAYGEMHKQKMERILADFPYQDIKGNFEIFDWGCGQGIASVCLIDFLKTHGTLSRLKKITLIEPSTAAIERASFNIKAQTAGSIAVSAINKAMPATGNDNNAVSKIDIKYNTAVHLFSNILDIESIDLKKLATLIAGTGYIHYFLCTGPINSGNYRIDAFSRYFNIHDDGSIFSDFRSGQYNTLANGHTFSCQTKGFTVVRKDGKPPLIPITFYPAGQFFAAFEPDSLTNDNDFQTAPETEQLYRQLSAFDVLAPFDIGADVYEDIHPVLAVLNNIITRGLPTRCSLWMEKALQAQYWQTEYGELYGSFSYKGTKALKNSNSKIRLAKSCIAAARLEKVILETVISGRLDINQPSWNILVVEKDVPCAALAVDDLACLFNHLTAMTRDYSGMRFPHVCLDVITGCDSIKWTSENDISFHSEQENELQQKKYDLVADIAIDEYSDAGHVTFSEFSAKNECYFNIRSTKNIYSCRHFYTTDLIDYKPMTVKDRQGRHSVIEENATHLRYFLQTIFRKVDFRPGQLPILTQALQNKSVIGLLPTGGGKSLTYQLAAMLEPGVSIIIDPLRSLMKDQYDGLIKNYVDCCTYINSSVKNDAPAFEREHREAMMESSQVLMTFLSPERLCIYKFRKRLKNMHALNVYFAYGVIDEVHCVSEWGQDFRFSYLHLGRNLYSYVLPKKGHIALFGLTATASFDVLSDVERELSGYGAFPLDANTVVRYENCNRLELQYKIERVDIEEYVRDDSYYHPTDDMAGLPSAVRLPDEWTIFDAKEAYLKKLIPRIPQYIRELETKENINRIKTKFSDRESNTDVSSKDILTPMPDNFLHGADGSYQQAGIIFCPHRANTGISVLTNSISLRELTPAVGTFTGGNNNDPRQDDVSMHNLELFRDNNMALMVATKAFGMGIDKPNVRFTVNMNYSSSLESYVQEAGRAGRDGKMALAVILFSDYDLVRINYNCPIRRHPIDVIIDKWFKKEDLKKILDHFNVQIPREYIDHCTPTSDIVKLKCPTNDNLFAHNHCTNACMKYDDCTLRQIPQYMHGWKYEADLRQYLTANHIRISNTAIEYQNADYGTEMFFFDNNFKGEHEEKVTMNNLLSHTQLQYAYEGNGEDSVFSDGNGFLNALLGEEEGQKLIVRIPYTEADYPDIAKAIYRLCCIGVIDDFTQHYGAPNSLDSSYFRIVCVRKKDGDYYKRLRDFLMRYYTEEKANNEVDKAALRKGQNEIHKCLGYLTEFVYDKIAIKRKRSIDDMRRFCLNGLSAGHDWKETNEELKDELYYYFNSKFARHGYMTEGGEPFSLLDDMEALGDNDTEQEYKILFKYFRVVDADVINDAGSTIDSIRHLYGAIRLITHRTFRDISPCLHMLNVYCLLFMRPWQNEQMMQELRTSFRDGYEGFRNKDKDYSHFLEKMQQFYNEMTANGRSAASAGQIDMLRLWQKELEVSLHEKWLTSFSRKYSK